MPNMSQKCLKVPPVRKIEKEPEIAKFIVLLCFKRVYSGKAIEESSRSI